VVDVVGEGGEGGEGGGGDGMGVEGSWMMGGSLTERLDWLFWGSSLLSWWSCSCTCTGTRTHAYVRSWVTHPSRSSQAKMSR
jgi:hypothetical protein